LILSYNDDFEVVWEDPSRDQESWVHDRLHAPWAQPPLTQAIFARIMDLAFDVPTVFVNCYAFMRDFGPPATTPEVEERGPIPIWEEDFEPAVRAACATMRGRDYESMPGPELAALLPQYFDETGSAFRYTTVVIFAFMRPTSRLIEFLEAELGEEGGGLAARLLQGYDNVTTEADTALQNLVDMAASHTELAEALQAGEFVAIPEREGGPDFLEALRAFTDAYGWRAESWYMAHLPTWAEDETLLMRLIGRYLEDPAHSPGARLIRSVSLREQAEREARTKLPADKVARFEELLQASTDHVGISEGRAYWQLQVSGSIRVPVLALGRKLVAERAIDDANDIFFLRLEEVQVAARDPAGRDWKSIVTANKAELARCQKLAPPNYLGRPPSVSRAPADLQAVMKHLRGYGVSLATDLRRVNGVAASRGLHRGTARVITGLDEGHRLQPGDILVCRTTAPPWTSLFAIAGAVVSDAGGLLSHTAICAREYGIPSVVATQVATTKIPDGATITVDGDKGYVTIED
jgi:phosphohistidine swiveling domain-containing protein